MTLILQLNERHTKGGVEEIKRDREEGGKEEQRGEKGREERKEERKRLSSESSVPAFWPNF